MDAILQAAVLADVRGRKGLDRVRRATAYRQGFGSVPGRDRELVAAVLADMRGRTGLDRVRRAAAYRQRFGSAPGLEAELAAAIEAVLSRVRVFDATTARAALPRLEALEGVSGPTAPLLAFRAKAHHLLGEYGPAEAAYKAWLRPALPDHAKRKQMAMGLFKAQRRQRLEAQLGEGLALRLFKPK